MIESILELLINFGFLYKDYKHQERISKKEKEDGIKRPFQKYILRPSNLMFITIIIIVSLSTFLFLEYQRTSVSPKETKKEMAKMSNRIKKWKEKFGQYPTELKILIKKNPIRQGWINDAWNRPYKYAITDNGKRFLITSAGSDGQFETEDDIKSE